MCFRPRLWFVLCGEHNITKKETLRKINLTRAWAILWYWNQHWVSKIAAQCNKVYKICLVDIFSLLQRWIHSSGWKHKSKNCTTLFCHQRKTIPLPHNLNTNPPTTASHPCPWQQMFSNQEMTLSEIIRDKNFLWRHVGKTGYQEIYCQKMSFSLPFFLTEPPCTLASKSLHSTLVHTYLFMSWGYTLLGNFLVL